MYNLFLADLYKLRKSAAIKFLFGITVFCSIAMITIAYMVQYGKLNTSSTGIGFLISDANMLSILGSVIAGIFICGDFDNRTIHEAIVDGGSRSQVVRGKAALFSCAVLFILLPYIIAVCIGIATGYKFSMGAASVGFLHILTSDAGKTLSAAQIFKLGAIILTISLVYIAQLSLCIPVAILSKKPVIVVAVYYGFTILGIQLTSLAKGNKLFDYIYSCTPYGGTYCFLTLNSGTEDFVKAICVSIIFIIVMIGITCFAFRKSEIK